VEDREVGFPGRPAEFARRLRDDVPIEACWLIGESVPVVGYSTALIADATRLSGSSPPLSPNSISVALMIPGVLFRNQARYKMTARRNLR
jgi:hypothetical protein